MFDSAGNLYGAFNPGGGYATPGRYNASQLVGTGSVSDPPNLTISPGVPFYADMLMTPQNQLIIAPGSLYRYSSTQLAQNGANVSTVPEATITLSGVTGFSPAWETLDPNGNLWVGAGRDHVYRLAAADLAQTGTVAIAPSVTLRAPVSNSGATFGCLAVH